jgi:hypothetical protein
MAHATLAFVGVVITLVLVIGGAVAYLPQTLTVTPSGYALRSSGETGSIDGLVLGAAMNASVVPPSQTITLQIWERNSLDVQSNITTARSWPFSGLSLGPCGPLNRPFGFEVLSGYYTQSSPGLISAEPIHLYAPGIYNCPAFFNVGSYSFYPQSTNASLGGFCTPACFTETMNDTSEIGGEYLGTSTSISPLPSGVYTVVVGDEWGAAVILNFEVSSSGSKGTTILPAGTSVEVSSSYDCVAGHFELQFEVSSPSVLTGGFAAAGLGVTLYVATVQQASNLTQGHPSQWVYTSGLQNSTSLSISLSHGSYLLWIEGADLNCGAKISIPLEMLTQVNVTRSFNVTTA